MKELMTKNNLMYAGIGLLTAFIVYKIIVKSEKPKETVDTKGKPLALSVYNKSSFCGCGA